MAMKYQRVASDLEDDNEVDIDNDDEVTIDLQSAESAATPSTSKHFNFWNNLMFSFMKPLLELGNKQPLTQENLLPLDEADNAATIYKLYKLYWKKYKGSKHALFLTYLYAYGAPFLYAGLLKLFHDSCLFIGPMLLNSNESIYIGYHCVFGFFVVNVVMSLCLRQYFWWCFRVGMRLRSSVITSVYHKTLMLSPLALAKRSVGEVTNLMAVDSTRLQQLTPYLHAVWYSFLQITIAMFLLWQQVGIACLGGLGVIILAVPLTGKVSAYLKKVQSRLSGIRDQRVKLTSEILSSIRVIKYQAWEAEFHSRINAVRTRELETYRTYVFAAAIGGSIYTALPITVAVVTFATYVGLGHKLTVARALTSLALFDLLRFPLFMLPNVINSLIEASVSVQRLQTYLLESEKYTIPRVLPSKQADDSSSTSSREGIFLENAYFSYESAKLKLKSSDRSAATTSSSWRMCCTKAAAKEASQDIVSDMEYDLLVHNSLLSSAEVYIQHLEGKLGSAQEQIRGMSPSLSPSLSSDDLEDELEMEAPTPTSTAGSVTPTPSVTTSPTSSSLPNGNTSTDPTAPALVTLHRLSIKATRGALITVVGRVGSGKSSLLLSILGDLKLTHGNMAVNAALGYVAQKPFVSNATVRDNILFGKPYNESWYNRVVELCALTADFNVLPGGDLTEIGERGINLSGGQKTRIALARAVYAILPDPDSLTPPQTTLLLLDDVLAAVDSHVAKHIYNSLLSLLKTHSHIGIVLVTNNVTYCTQASEIVVLDHGRVVEQGTFATLIESKKYFYKLYQHYQHKLTNQEKKAANSSAAKDSTTAGVEKKNTTGVSIVTTEDREVGTVSWKVYKLYAVAMGGLLAMLLLALYLVCEVIGISASVILSNWGNHPESTGLYLGLYAGVNLVYIIVVTSRELLTNLRGLTASAVLYERLLGAVLYAPMHFFDTTPLGRIINRFSKDIYTVDEEIPKTVRMYLGTMTKVVMTIGYIVIVTPMFLLGLLPLSYVYYSAQKYFIRTSRELTRLDNISRSPIYAQFTETLYGLTTLRAYRAEPRLISTSYSLLDRNQQAYFLNFSANCWLGVRLELIGALIVTLTALFAVIGREHKVATTADGKNDRGAYAALAGLAISMAMSITQSLNWSVRMASDLESQMIAVERIQTYAELEREGARVSGEVTSRGDVHSPMVEMGKLKNWPSEGRVEFRNVSMRYRDGLPLVLNGINLLIEGKSKVGVVGRTGAGKSSLVLALLRIVELAEGSIVIDNVDVATLSLEKLRSSIAVIAQDPVLFSGTVRSNLDPFNRYTDTQVWESIRRCELNTAVQSLNDAVEESGHNYSVGQRQLLCIARALLANAKIILMDEATAAVDVETDAAIQRTLRHEFASSTTITIAHRLNTIMDSDMILVMDQGQVAEYAPPAALLEDHNSAFYALVQNWEDASH